MVQRQRVSRNRLPDLASATRSSGDHQPLADEINPDELKRLRARLLRLLARREYSQHELRNRLMAPSRRTGDRASPEAVEAALDWAQMRDLQSDERFAEALIRRSTKRLGLSRIRAQLKSHRIEPDITSRQLGRLAETEYSRAFDLWQNRFGQLPETEREKARQFRFLLSRGFRNETVLTILRGRQP